MCDSPIIKPLEPVAIFGFDGHVHNGLKGMLENKMYETF